MKKSLKFLSGLFVLVLAAVVTGCKANVDSGEGVAASAPEVSIAIPSSAQPEEISAPKKVAAEDKSIANSEPTVTLSYATGNTAEDGLTEQVSDLDKGYILKVTPTKDGLLIEKTNPASWEHNTIHVKNSTYGYELFKITDVDEKTNTILYPFVEAYNTYEVWIEKQETGWTNCGETSRVKVNAVGGKGDFAMGFDKYYYNPVTHEITFKDLNLLLPEMLKNSGYYFSGPVFNGKPWDTGVTSNYSVFYIQDNSKITITGDAVSFIDKAKKTGVIIELNFSVESFNFRHTILSEVVYDSTKSTDVLVLTGGVSLPKVTLSHNGGWSEGTTYHYGSDWATNNTIKIENTENTLATTAVSIKDRGNSTKWTAKVPYSLKFTDKTKILGQPKSKRWVLMANYYDRSLIRTDFAGYLGNNVFNSYWNASFTPVNVYINSTFIGTYDMGECNKVEKNRVNIQSIEDFADGKTLEDVNGDGKVNIEDCGFMVEIDTSINYNGALNKNNYKTKVGIGSGAERIYFYSAEKCIPMTLKDPDFGDGTKYSEELCLEMGNYAKSKIDAFEQMLYSSDFKSKYTDYIDALSFIDWYLINEFGKNSDANFQKSVPVTYDPADGKLHMGPNWDFDLAFGNFNCGYDTPSSYDNCETPEGWYIHNGKKWVDENALVNEIRGTYCQTYWINRLFESSSFKKAVKARWNDRKLFLKNAINEQILNYANMVNDSIADNEAICPRIGVEEWNGPSDYGTRSTYKEEITYLYDWCIARYNWMDSQISKW